MGKRNIKHFCLICLLIIFNTSNTLGQTKTYIPTKGNIEARKTFQDNKFGIFIHWGIYSMTGQGEWYMNTGNINRDEYAKLASGFYPSKFNAAEWVSNIKASGAKYICITTRHHDGFSMFKTKYSKYNIVDATPFKRDIIREIADECHKQGIILNLYYSHLDWSRDDYPLGNTGRNCGRPTDKQNWNSYYKFMNNQLSELLTNYGKIGAIWFDGYWDKKGFDWQLPKQYALIHSIQPSCLIGNNHHESPIMGEDFQMFERDLPGKNESGLSGQEIGSLPLETCDTMGDGWGFWIGKRNYKDVKSIIHYLVNAAGNNANLLLNIDPQPNGEIPATALERLKEVGKWMDKYGATIYGTRGGEIKPHSWGATTRKANTLYVHILDCQDKSLFIPTELKVKKAKLFKNGAEVNFKQEKDGVLLSFDRVPDDIDYVVELEMPLAK